MLLGAGVCGTRSCVPRTLCTRLATAAAGVQRPVPASVLADIDVHEQQLWDIWDMRLNEMDSAGVLRLVHDGFSDTTRDPRAESSSDGVGTAGEQVTAVLAGATTARANGVPARSCLASSSRAGAPALPLTFGRCRL